METKTIEDIVEDVASSNGIDADALMAYARNMGYGVDDDWDDIVSDFQDAFVGEYEDAQDFCREIMWEMCADIPDWVVSHIDWDSVWECELRHDFFEEDGYYFRNI